jgi:putative ABC transport system permease protein
VSRMGKALAPAVLARRRLRSDLPLAAAVFGVVLVTSFVFAAVPRTFDKSADDGLRFAVGEANPLTRNVEVTRAGRIRPGARGDPFAPVEVTGARLERSFPASLRTVIRGRRQSVETVRYTVVDAPGVPGPAGTTRLLTLESVQGAPARVRLVQGRLPSGRNDTVPFPFREGQDAGPVVEVAVSQEQAGQLSLGVGDLLYLAADSTDPLVGEVPLSERRLFAARVTGIFAPRQAADAAWLADARLGRAVTKDTDLRRFVYGYGLFANAAYGTVSAATEPLPLRYSWRYAVDAEGFGAGDFDRLQADIRRLDSRFGESTFGQRLGTGVRTGLSRVFARYRADRDAAAAVLAVGAVGLLALALAVVALLGGLAAARRREGIALVRSRGGVTWQVLGGEALDGVLVALPAATLGYAVAWLAVGGRGALPSGLLAAGIVLATGAIMAGAALGAARSGLTPRARDEVAVSTLSPRRLALEAFVVALSLAGVYLLRRRGLGDTGGIDLYLAAVPPLLGLAVGIVAVRLYPLPLRLLAGAAGRRRDLVPSLALRRVARQPGVTAAPLLVLLLGVSVSVFMAAMAGTLSQAQEGALGTLSPLATRTLDAFRRGALLAGAYAAVVLLLAPLLTARARLRDLAYLSALGLSRRQAVAVTAMELAPPVVVAVVLGTALGLAVAYIVEPGLDLAALGAGGHEVAVRLDPFAPLLLVAALLLVSAAAVWATAAVMRRTSLSRVLRMGER